MKNPASVHIHFVCTGNIFRSRLAEAYLRSKQISSLLVSSSGINASTQHKGPISWHAMRLLFRHDLISFMSTTWKETTAKHTTSADIVVFIGKKTYNSCKQRFPAPKKHEIWDLPDFDDKDMNNEPLDIKREIECIKSSENIFKLIRNKTDKLILTHRLAAKK